MNQSQIDKQYMILITALYRGRFDPNEWRKFIDFCRLHGFTRDADTAEQLCANHIELNKHVQCLFEGCTDWYEFKKMIDNVRAR